MVGTVDQTMCANFFERKSILILVRRSAKVVQHDGCFEVNVFVGDGNDEVVIWGSQPLDGWTFSRQTNSLTENECGRNVLEIIRQMINMGFIVKDDCSSAQLKRDQSRPDKQWNAISNQWIKKENDH